MMNTSNNSFNTIQSSLTKSLVVLSLLFCLFLCTGVFAEVIQIDNIDELQLIGNDPGYPLNGEYELSGNIDASDTINWNSGAGFKPIGTDADPFTGNFDGNGYKITGLYINRPTEDYIGLFGYLDSGVVVNVGIEDCQIVGKYEVGGLVGRNYGTIFDSYSIGSVQGKYNIGGLVGENYDTLSNSYSTGSVKGGGEVGGLVGYNNGTISDSYSTGSIQGEYDVGGLVGLNENIVTNCYSTGLVIGSGEVGGLVGYDWGGTVSNSYWDTQTSGLTTSAGGEGKTIEEMRQQATFEGWDFTTVWAIEEDSSYPYLQGLGGNQIVHPQTAGTIEISNLEELSKIGLDSAYPWWWNYELVADIDASDTINWNEGKGFNPLLLTGHFNGNGHVIQGLYINRPDENKVGLFSYLSETGEINNIGIKDCQIVGNDYVGGLVGNNYGTISDGYSIGSIEGTYYIGGLVGFNNGTISDSYSTGSVSGSQIIGGLVGTNDGTISNSYSTCTAEGEYTVGGLVGDNYGTISDSYGTGSVSSSDYVGGLVGWNEGVVTNSYSVGLVTGVSDVGGLIGENWGTITSSYWDTETSGQSSSAGGEGKTTAEMKQQATFVGWDFINVWNIVEDVTYPFLRSKTPEITILGETELTTECGEEYVDGGATAWDIPDGDLTSDIQVVNNVNSNAVGDYTVDYSVTDSSSNTSTAQRIVHVVDTTAPEITLNGDNPMTVECDSVFIDPSAEATDTCDSEVSAEVLSNNVNTSQTGTYQVVYHAVDNSGNSAEKTREVIVDCAGEGTVEGVPEGIPEGVVEGSAEGEGMSEVIQIDSIEELQLIGNDAAYPLDGEYKLTQDIDASDTVNWNNGSGFKPIGTDSDLFLGKFIGNGYKIIGLYINRSNEDYIGLFGYVASGGVVENVGMEDCQIVGRYYVGDLIGHNAGTMSNSYSTGSTSGSDYVGGLVGVNSNTVYNSYSTGSIQGEYDVGGLVGDNYGTISNSYSTGSVSGIGAVGGLLGYNISIITNCYSACLVTGDGNIGGLVGYDGGGSTVSNSYWDTQTSGQTSSAGGTGKTTAEMKQQLTYDGWDFATIWAIIEEQSYPYFLWQTPPTEGEGSVEGEGIQEGSPEGTVEGSTEGTAEGSTEGTTEGTTEGEGSTEGVIEGSTEGTTEGEMPPHSADPNGDGMIGLGELLRVIQFFNMGGYHCEAGTEDGYAGGYDGDKTCAPHASDYDEQDWIIDLGELLRLIQFFNMGGYYPCPGIGEDGYCPGTE